MTANRRDAVDSLYAEFSGAGCTALESSGDDCARDGLAVTLTAQLCGRDTRSLDGGVLLDYYYLAVDHIGTAEDLRHFLPRILELILEEPKGYLEPLLLPQVLTRAAPAEMTASQRAALRQFFEMARGVLPDAVVNESLKVLQS